jgi:hypothetical protein
MICGLVEGNILTGSHPCFWTLGDVPCFWPCMANLSAGHHSHTITASCLTICLLFSVFYKINENLRNQGLAQERTTKILESSPAASSLQPIFWTNNISPCFCWWWIQSLLSTINYPLVIDYIAMEHGPLIDDYPLYNKMVMFHSCLRLPQASQLPWYHIKSSGFILKSRFSMIFP